LRRLLVVCEGKVTEPAYLLGFERSIQNAKIVIDIPPQIQGVPLTLVRRAHSLSQNAKERARRENDDFIAYDETWCVFDIDEHPHINEALQFASANGIKLAVSNPCFELWLLLHFREQPGARHRHEIQQMLGGFIAGYDKHLNFAAVEQGITDAVRRARRLDLEAIDEGEAGRNPSTGVYLLIESIARRDDDV
jgi:hypothetical protein